MSTVNPYESPSVPAALELPGAKYRVDRRRLSLTEHLQQTRYPVKGIWNWLSLRLGIDAQPTYIQTVAPVREMTVEIADMPPVVGERLLQFGQQAEALGFYGKWLCLTKDEEGNPTTCALRMLCQDPRMYLEIAFLAFDRTFVCRHNLVSAGITGKFVVTSNGFPTGRWSPVILAEYDQGLALDRLLPKHLKRIDGAGEPFQEIRAFEQIAATVQELVNLFVQFQIARGLWTPIDPETTNGQLPVEAVAFEDRKIHRILLIRSSRSV